MSDSPEPDWSVRYDARCELYPRRDCPGCAEICARIGVPIRLDSCTCGGIGATELGQAFIDDISGRECTLVVPPGGKVYPAVGEPKIGIVHPDCDALADLAIELDAFYCPRCRWNGRVSGIWCLDAIDQARFRSLRTRNVDRILLPLCGVRRCAFMQVRCPLALR